MLDIPQPIVHDVFIVFSEEEYGGRNKIKAFYQHSDAETYLEDGLGDLEGSISHQTLISPWDKIYVVVFELAFGGDADDLVKCFTVRDLAVEYLLSKSEELNLDGEIITTDVLVTSPLVEI